MIEQNPFFGPFAGGDLGSVPHIVMAMLVAILVLGVLTKHWRRSGRRGHGRRRHAAGAMILPFQKARQNTSTTNTRNMHLPEQQMIAVAAATFETQPLLNKSEARLLPVIEATLAELGRGHRVMAQTSVGEVLRPCNDQDAATRDAAHAAINSKRFDFSVIDCFGRLVVAIEYQGGGHYRKTAFMRDAVKREACRKAGVAFIEVHTDTLPHELKEQLVKLIGFKSAVGSAP